MLTKEQMQIILTKIAELRRLDGKAALIKNNALFKFLVQLNANGFIDNETFHQLDTKRFNAFMRVGGFEP